MSRQRRRQPPRDEPDLTLAETRAMWIVETRMAVLRRMGCTQMEATIHRERDDDVKVDLKVVLPPLADHVVIDTEIGTTVKVEDENDG